MQSIVMMKKTIYIEYATGTHAEMNGQSWLRKLSGLLECIFCWYRNTLGYLKAIEAIKKEALIYQIHTSVLN